MRTDYYRHESIIFCFNEWVTEFYNRKAPVRDDTAQIMLLVCS